MSLPIVEASQTGDARRAAVRLAEEVGMDETARGRVAIVVTEVARNLALHAHKGEMLLRGLDLGGNAEIEVLAVDKGPGITDLAGALADGVSTRGTPGTGLGAVRRLSELFDVYSRCGSGTALVAQVYARKPDRDHQPQMAVGAVSVPRPGEMVCGDVWDFQRASSYDLLMVADGLGHGEHAAEAAQVALRIFRENVRASPGRIIETAHLALRPTRGAAMAVALLDRERREVRYAGIGNIVGVVIAPDGSSRNMVSHNGTVGHELRRVHEFAYPWTRGTTVVMNSDGVATWHLDHYPGLLARHPSLIAGILYRDFKRSRDDATVVVARESV